MVAGRRGQGMATEPPFALSLGPESGQLAKPLGCCPASRFLAICALSHFWVLGDPLC